MIKYTAKAQIDGIELSLIYSQAPDKFYVLYGLERTDYETISGARVGFEAALNHAFECGGYSD